MSRRRSVTAAAATVIVLCFTLNLALASAEYDPSKTATNKTVAKSGGSSCASTDIGCARCAGKGSKGGGACLACSTNGPVKPTFVEGRCLCAAGTAKLYSNNTVNLPLDGSATKGTGGSGPVKSGGGGKGKGGVTDVACAPCAENAYASIARPVGVSKCTVCPQGTTTRGAIGSTACYVAPGEYFNAAGFRV